MTADMLCTIKQGKSCSLESASRAKGSMDLVIMYLGLAHVGVVNVSSGEV